MAKERGSHQELEGRAAERRGGPPMPRAVYRVVNPTLKTLLRSPLHRLLSNSLMVLTFQGRKSGKRYSIPVGYLQKGNQLFLFTHGNWWKNIRGGVPVSVRLRGQEMQGTAAPIEDPALVTRVVQDLVARHGEAMARRMGLIADGQRPEAANTPSGTVFIKIDLEERGR